MKFAMKILLGTAFVVMIALLAYVMSAMTGWSYDQTFCGITLGALGYEIADRIVDERVQS